MESIDVWWVILYFLIATITIPVVIFLGPVAIRNYVLESDYDDATGKTNVIYRILSPALCSSIFILVIEVLFSKFGASAPTQRWLCSLFYWAILGIAKLLARKNVIHPVAYFIEATCSVLLSALLERFVIGGYSSLGIAVLDQSNFAFEMEVAVFYVAVQMVVTIAARHRYRVSVLANYGGSEKTVASTEKTTYASSKLYYHAAVDTSEKNLFGYERRYGSLLSIIRRTIEVNERREDLQEIIDKALEEMAAETGEGFDPQECNLADFCRRTELTRSKNCCGSHPPGLVRAAQEVLPQGAGPGIRPRRRRGRRAARPEGGAGGGGATG